MIHILKDCTGSLLQTPEGLYNQLDSCHVKVELRNPFPVIQNEPGGFSKLLS